MPSEWTNLRSISYPWGCLLTFNAGWHVAYQLPVSPRYTRLGTLDSPRPFSVLVEGEYDGYGLLMNPAQLPKLTPYLQSSFTTWRDETNAFEMKHFTAFGPSSQKWYKLKQSVAIL